MPPGSVMFLVIASLLGRDDQNLINYEFTIKKTYIVYIFIFFLVFYNWLLNSWCHFKHLWLQGWQMPSPISQTTQNWWSLFWLMSPGSGLKECQLMMSRTWWQSLSHYQGHLLSAWRYHSQIWNQQICQI